MLLASATELARAIRTGEVRSRTVVDAHIARIQAVNPRINAVVADRFDAARAEADAADAAVAAGGELPPLHGVPCTVKEAFAVTGMPWTGGLLARKGTVADEDAVTVTRLRDAGAIVLGVTNLSELCMWMESDNPVYGRTSNPYDAGRTAGGSSGGEGAIVGAGASPFGLGADVGGSIRMPAFFNGVFGHKPGSGVVPNAGQFPVNTSEAGLRLLGTGPIARRGEDLPLLMRLLAGPTDDDPIVGPDPLGDPEAVTLSGMRVLVVPDNGFTPVDPALTEAQDRAARGLAELGAEVSTARFPLLKRSFDLWSTAMGEAEGPGAFRTLMRRPSRLGLLPHLFRPTELGGVHTLPATILGLVEDVGSAFPSRTARFTAMRHALREELVDAIGDGVLLYPPYPVPAPRHREPWLRPLSWVYTAIFNALGFPVTQVPLGLDAQGLPLGVQIVGAPGNDHVTIAAAVALEQAGVARWVPPPA
ncbi:MAG: amidase [Alphaproteobacteria bacterium]|nr:amidase [Alphaproteobacteria bacterium]